MKNVMVLCVAVLSIFTVVGCSSHCVIPFTSMQIVPITDDGDTLADKREGPESTSNSSGAMTTRSAAPGEKLQELKDLREKGLISEEEYQQKRKAIVDGL